MRARCNDLKSESTIFFAVFGRVPGTSSGYCSSGYLIFSSNSAFPIAILDIVICNLSAW